MTEKEESRGQAPTPQEAIKNRAVCFAIEVVAGITLIGISIIQLFFHMWPSYTEGIETGRDWNIHKIPAVCSILIVLISLGYIGYTVGPGVVYTFNSYSQSTPVITNESIYSLTSGSGVQGSFFLGCGNVNSIMYYEFYSKSGDAYYISKVPADGTAVYMDENQAPYLKTTTWIYTIHHPDGKITGGGKDYSQGVKYELHVPSETIKQTFALNGGT
ncbi:MAG: hypothetical protein PHX61_02435 [Alphaproteobacteria bacterium]|nr:hypothetical protein [Alphaproteobacteria bacterium]